MLHQRRSTRLVRCGYRDRFDPFVLNDDAQTAALYDDLFRTFLAPRKCRRLLDAGCGTGIYFKTLAAYAQRIDAIDDSEDMIAVARSYCRETGLDSIAPCTGSVEALPWKNGCFDVVTAMDLMHHVENPGRVIGEFHRVLRPGGHLFVLEPNVLNPLMFLAHALPAEERLALRRSRPRTLIGLFEPHFETVGWRGICALITRTAGIRAILLEGYLRACRALLRDRCYPRQAWLGRRREQ